jgi:hypothetical protein
MTGRERVKASLTFKKLDRVPRDLWALPYVTLFKKDDFEKMIKKYPMDISASQLSPGWSDDIVKQTATKGSYVDDWGSVWHVGEPGIIGEVKKPVLEDWLNLKKFKPPYHLIEDRNISYINKSYEKTDNFILSDVTARPFERLQFLRGTQNLFLDIGYDVTEFRKLLKIIHEFYLADIESWCKTDVDGIFFMDDLGTNLAPLINPEVWREVFKPLYKEYCDMIHASGKFAFFHTDGNTEAIFGDFIEVGIDAINSQLFAMNIEDIAKEYKGKITFWGEIDRQNILPFGSTEDVYNAVLRIRKTLGGDKGGVIAQCEWGKNNPIENIETVFQTWGEEIV